MYCSDTKNHGERVKFALEMMKLARQKYAWPGGYEIIFLTSDGEYLCADCVRSEANQTYRDTRDWTGSRSGSGWEIAAIGTADYLEESTLCAHCGRELCPYSDD